MPNHGPVSTQVVANENWKKTALGTPIALFASAPLQELKALRPILLMGGIHGDEPEGVRLATDTLAWLKSNSRDQKTICPWIIIPCLNVDGFKARTRVNGRGVDLNRNYPSRDWSPEAKAERYFPGPHAGSEPEIQAVVELLRDFNPRLVIHCHSWNPCIVGTGALSKTDAARLAKSSGYDVVEEIGYPTPGSLSRYAWHDHKIPVICIEEQDDLTDLESVWPRFKQGMTEIFQDLSLRDAPEAAK